MPRKSKHAKAIAVFERIVAEIRKLPPDYDLYVAGSTLCLMCGPDHDNTPEARPLRRNMVDNEGSLRIGGGDW